MLRSVSDEIGLVLGAHRRTAARWLNRAAVLVERFPATHELLASGGITVAAAQIIAKELACVVDDELRAGVEALVLAWGQRYGWARIKQIAQREAAKVVAEYDSLTHDLNVDERTTYMENHGAGIADLVISTDAVDVTGIMVSLTARAAKLRKAGDPRSLDQLRTDLAVERLLGPDSAHAGNEGSRADADSDSRAGAAGAAGTEASGASSGPRGPGESAEVRVVIHCTAAEAAALASGEMSTGGELEGYGPLPQDALALAFKKATFRYRLTDVTPQSDPERHDPSPGLAQHVRDRDRWCVFPGCTAPAIRCDLDHRHPYPDGATDAHNLECLCRHHHRLKHLGNWQAFITEDGTLIWIGPTGRAYVTPAAMPHAA